MLNGPARKQSSIKVTLQRPKLSRMSHAASLSPMKVINRLFSRALPIDPGHHA